MHRLEELVRLHRMGTGSREVARLLRMGPNTERQYREAIAAEGLLGGSPDELPLLEALKAAVLKHRPRPELPRHQVTSLSRWQGLITKLFEDGVGPRAIHDRLRLEHTDFDGTYWAVRRLCRTLRRQRGVQPEDVAIPVETDAGEIAQVDFGYLGKLLDPVTMTLRKAWCFVLVLGFSRHMVVRIVFDQKIETWLRLHVEAFEELGGVVATVVPDNLKAAVVRAAFGVDGTTELNRSYVELARHCGFKVDPTPPRDPRKKGKVEAAVKYVKRNFFAGRERSDVTEARQALGRWVREIAGTRKHGTTGARPLEVFESLERAALRPVPERRFDFVVWKKAKVHRDSHIAFGPRLYSVPWPLIGTEVWVRATASTVTAYADDERVATHDRNGPGYRSTKAEHLPDHRVDLRHRSREYWQRRAEDLGPEVGAYVREIFDAEDVLSQLRTVQAIVTHLEAFPQERARKACQRAAHFGSYGYPAIKNILRRALDLEALPATSIPLAAAANDAPRFARAPAEWARRIQEVQS